MNDPEAMWTLNRALGLIRGTYPHAAGAGWYLCLGGGVLVKGYSDHDLDIIAIPHYGAKLDDLYTVLRDRKWVQKRTAEQMRASWKEPDKKHVEEWEWAGKRIDLIVYRTPDT